MVALPVVPAAPEGVLERELLPVVPLPVVPLRVVPAGGGLGAGRCVCVGVPERTVGNIDGAAMIVPLRGVRSTRIVTIRGCRRVV